MHASQETGPSLRRQCGAAFRLLHGRICADYHQSSSPPFHPV